MKQYKQPTLYQTKTDLFDVYFLKKRRYLNN